MKKSFSTKAKKSIYETKWALPYSFFTHTHREREITMQMKKERSAGAWEIK